MKKLISFLKNIICEITVIFLLILSFNNYLGNVHETIKADGIGYYDYLPSIFIHKDINRKNKPYTSNQAFYGRIISKGVYSDFNGYKLDKYPCGTAILISPFFLYTYISASIWEIKTDGYEYPYQQAVFYSAVFYLFLALFFLKKLLQLYGIKQINIFFSQLLIALATSVTNYANNDSSFSHIYSLFAISAFLYFVKSYFVNKNINHFIWACIFLALITILRNINVIIILFIPFLAGSTINLKQGFVTILKYPVKLLIAVLCIVGIVSIQCVFWYLQTGKFIVYSYQNEEFNFLSPAFIDILFSYRKGLFVYAPVLFLSLFGIVRLINNRQYYLVFTWLAFFLFLNYILSSWWCWFYGCSFGMRAYIDFYPIFFILFAILINRVVLWLKILVMLISLTTIPLNLIQTYQYKEFILRWDGMDRKTYWEVFLKQDEKYEGYLFKRGYDFNQYAAVQEIALGKINASANTETSLLQINSDTINRFDKVNLIQVMFDNKFSDDDDSKLLLVIKDSITNIESYRFNPSLILFAEKGLNKFQTGVYNFEAPPNPNKTQVIILTIYSPIRKDILENLKVTFFTPR